MAAEQRRIEQPFDRIDNELDLLLALGKHVVTELDLDQLLQRVAEYAQQVIDAETMVVPLIDFARNEYTYRSACGASAADILHQSLPLSVGMCGWVLSNQQPLLFGRGSPLTMDSYTEWEEGMESALLVPLISRGQIIGGLSGLGKKHGGSFTRRDLDLLTLFASQASVAIENAQILRRQAEQQRQLQELLGQARYEKTLAETTLESIVDAVVVTDADGTVLNINRGALSLLEIERPQAIDSPIEQLMTFMQQDSKVRSCVRTALETDTSVRIEQIADEAVNREGGRFSVEGSVAILRDADGEVAGTVMTFRDISEKKRLTERLHHEATYDTLTNLINRREFEARLCRSLNGATSDGAQPVLCYMDLDQFKIVNDTCGHAAGDRLLSELCSVLQRHVRENDTLARIGGDEFALLLENSTLEDATKVAERIRRDIEAFSFIWNERPFRVGVSIGVVPVTSEIGGIGELLSAADRACYAAKEQGRNRIRVYYESDEELSSRHREMQWVARIHEALDAQRFTLHCQPIAPAVPTHDDGIAYELLLRLHDADGTLLLPGAFMPAAERFDLMPSIDRWVVDSYLSWLAQRPEHLQNLSMAAINLSGQTLSNLEHLDHIENSMRRYPAACRKICFEVTETAAIGNIARAKEFVERMRARGVRFSLDDFGTGMSSFSYLKNLPVDFIKIDGSFVRHVCDDPFDSRLVASIIDIAKILGKQTVAEYVETAAIHEYVSKLGIDYVQGFWVARPMPLDEIGDRT